MQYEITWLEQKTTSTGKVKANAQLRGAEGKLIENVTIWSDYPDFVNLRPGSTVEGDLVPARDPKYGPTLYGKKANLGPRPAWAKKENTIAKAQDRKEEGIKTAQERTQEGVSMSGSARDATLILTTFYQGLSDDDLKAKWDEWRKWLYGKYTEPFV